MDSLESTIVCRQCKIPYAPTPTRIRPTGYCSRLCFKLDKNYSTLRSEHACLQCGLVFYLFPSEVKAGEGNFCSKACAHQYSTVELSCPYCKKQFVRKRSYVTTYTEIYCSQRCKKTFHRLRLIDKICLACGVHFVPIRFRSRKGRIYLYIKDNVQTCSPECSLVVRPIGFGGQKPSHGKHNANWQGGRSSLHVSFRGYGWKQLAEKIRKRERYCCRYCGKTQEANGRKLDVNHIIPWFNFTDPRKANALSNLEALCRSCHTSKEARTNTQLAFTFMNGKHRKVSGYIPIRARFTPEEVQYIRMEYDAGMPCTVLAEQFRCKLSTIARVANRTSYKYVVSPLPGIRILKRQPRQHSFDVTGVRHMMPQLYTGTKYPERDESIAHRVLSGESYAAVARYWAMSKQSAWQIVLRWCARQAPEVFARLGKAEYPEREAPRPSLVMLRAHREAFGIVSEQIGA